MATIEDAQAIANITAKQLGLKKRPKVKIGWRAEAFTDDGYFIIPPVSLSYPSAIFTYLVLHETCHFMDGGIHHGVAFRAYEDKMMAFWHLSYKRKKNRMVDIEGVRYKGS